MSAEKHNTPDRGYMIFFEQSDPVCIDLARGVLNDLSAEFLLAQPKPVATFVIGGHSITRCGARKDLSNMMLHFDFESSLVCDVPAEPDINDVARIISVLKQNASSEVVAIGGGSVLDAAKAAWLSYQSGMDVKELFGVNKASEKFPGRTFKRIIAVPTTAGTGSEATPYANIVDREAGVKCLISERQIVPRMALIDPDYGRSMPRQLTIATALDAMVHNIEALLNTKSDASPYATDEWAVHAVRMICENLPLVLRDPNDSNARERLCAAATIGGIEIASRPTSLPHLGSFSLYGKLAHGLAVALLLPPFWRYYLADEAAAKQTMLLADIFPSDEPQTTPESVVNAASAFIAAMTGTANLSSLPFFDAAMVEKIASDALKNPMKLASAPRAVAPESAASVISTILNGELQA